MIGFSKRVALALSLLCLFAGASWASSFTIPDGKLIPSTDYYTDIIGGGFGSPLLAPNDDDFSGPIELGFVLNLFGTNYTQFWVNNNGNVSFTDGIAAFGADPTSLGVNVPMIAPFFADVDTRGAGTVNLRNDIPNEIIVTWDQVGYYNQDTLLLNSFQLVIRGPDYVGLAGEGQVGFFYKTMTWETGDASGGNGGFSIPERGIPAAIGFDDGSGNNEILLERSLQDGISATVSDHHIWFDRDVAPGLFAEPVDAPQVPEPATLLLVGTGAAFLGRKLYSRKRQT